MSLFFLCFLHFLCFKQFDWCVLSQAFTPYHLWHLLTIINWEFGSFHQILGNHSYQTLKQLWPNFPLLLGSHYVFVILFHVFHESLRCDSFPVFSSIKMFHKKEWKDGKSQRFGMTGQNDVFWQWQGHCTHELSVTLNSCTKSRGSPFQHGQRRGSWVQELLKVDGWRETVNFL